MKCPTCIEDGQKSKVFDRGSRRTMLNNSTWYDEEGNVHHHDTNITTTGYECSNGHKFEISKRGIPCPSFPDDCDYGGEVMEKYLK